LLQGFIGAVALHGAYDFFIFQKNFPALTGLTMVTLVVGIALSRRMIRIHQEMSPFNNAIIAAETIEISNELDFIPDENENPYAQDDDDEDDSYSLL
jgi:hypothetical protein